MPLVSLSSQLCALSLMIFAKAKIHEIAVEYRSDALTFERVPIRHPQWPYDLQELAAFVDGALDVECEDFISSMKRDEASLTVSETYCHPEKGPFDELTVETNPLDLSLLRAKVQISFTALEAARSITEIDDFISTEGRQLEFQTKTPPPTVDAYDPNSRAMWFWVYSLIFLVAGVVFLPYLSPILYCDGEVSACDSRKKKVFTPSALQGETSAVEVGTPLLIALEDDVRTGLESDPQSIIISEVQKKLGSQDEDEDSEQRSIKSIDVENNETPDPRSFMAEPTEVTPETNEKTNEHSNSVRTELSTVVEEEVEDENQNDEDLLNKYQQEMEVKLKELKIENRILMNSVDDLIKEKRKSISIKRGNTDAENVKLNENCNTSLPLPLFLRGGESEFSPEKNDCENSFEGSIVLDDIYPVILSSPEYCIEGQNGGIGNMSSDSFLNINDMGEDDIQFNQSALFDDVDVDFSDVTGTAINEGKDYENKYISAMENIKQKLALDLKDVEELSTYHSKSFYDSDCSTDSSVDSHNENENENTFEFKMMNIINDREKIDMISKRYEMMAKKLIVSKNGDVTNKNSASDDIYMNDIYDNKTSNTKYLQEIEVLNTRLQYQIHTTRGARREIGLLKNTIEVMKSDKTEEVSVEEIIPTSVKISRYDAVNGQLNCTSSTTSCASGDCLSSSLPSPPSPLLSTPHRVPYNSRTHTSSPTLSCGTDFESIANSVRSSSPVYGSGCDKVCPIPFGLPENNVDRLRLKFEKKKNSEPFDSRDKNANSASKENSPPRNQIQVTQILNSNDGVIPTVEKDSIVKRAIRKIEQASLPQSGYRSSPESVPKIPTSLPSFSRPSPSVSPSPQSAFHFISSKNTRTHL